MSLVLTPLGEKWFLQLMMASSFSVPSKSFWMRLFVNNVTPTRNTAIGNLTEMSTSGTGYSSKEFTAAGWTSGTGVEGDPSTLSYGGTNPTWTLSSPPMDAYGIFLTNTYGELLGAERFTNAPFEIRSDGDQIKIPSTYMRMKDEGDIASLNFETSNASEVILLKRAGAVVYPSRYIYFEFFTNNFTPSDTTVSGDYTICADATFIGFFEKHPWDADQVSNGADRSSAVFPEITATSATFAGTIYGWRARDNTGGAIIDAGRFPTPLTIAIGEIMRFVPTWTLRSGSF